MLTGPQREEWPERPYVAIPLRATLREWGRVNACIGQVRGWLAEQQVEPTGAPFFRYWVEGDTEREFDLEVGWPVPHPVPESGTVIARTMPGGSYAVVVHTGHPDRIHEAHAALDAWAQREGMAFGRRTQDGAEIWDAWAESFQTDPEVQPDPEQWSTEVARLLRT